jgi:DNA-binding PadR family transcriptional regulator
MSKDLTSRILTLLAREFEYTQSLHSEKEDMMSKLGVDDTTSFDAALQKLEKNGSVNLWVDPRGKIKLAKITWRGLNEIGEVKLRYGLEVK